MTDANTPVLDNADQGLDDADQPVKTGSFMPPSLEIFGVIKEPVYYAIHADRTITLSNLPVMGEFYEVTPMSVVLEPFSPSRFLDLGKELQQASAREQVFIVVEWAVQTWGDTGEPPNPEILKQDETLDWAATSVYEFVNAFFRPVRFLREPANGQGEMFDNRGGVRDV